MPLQSSLQRIQRRLKSRQFRLHSVVAQDVRELRSLLGQRVSVVEVVHLLGLEVTPLLSTLTTRWFPPQRDPWALEGFYTPLHEDFYRAYVDSGIAFRPQRVCRLEALVEVVGEQLRPHLFFLPRLSDLLGRTRAYCGTWVREFYSSLWIDPTHQFIHFAFRGHDRRLYSTRVREILRLPASETKIHQLCFG
jgi:hypothetical protein